MTTNDARREVCRKTDQLRCLEEVRVGNTVEAEFLYAIDDRRVRRIADGVATYYLADGTEYTIDGTNTYFTYFHSVNGRMVAFTKSDTDVTTWMGADIVNSTSNTRDENGVTAQQRYTPFGEVRIDGNLATDHTYTGQVNDETTGLAFYNARYYDPATARFITPDSIVPNARDGQDYNRYTYVRNNPIKYNDPTGNLPGQGGDPQAEVEFFALKHGGFVSDGGTIVGSPTGIEEAIDEGTLPELDCQNNSGSSSAWWCSPPPNDPLCDRGGVVCLADVVSVLADSSANIALICGTGAVVTAPSGVGALSLGSCSLTSDTASSLFNAGETLIRCVDRETGGSSTASECHGAFGESIADFVTGGGAHIVIKHLDGEEVFVKVGKNALTTIVSAPEFVNSLNDFLSGADAGPGRPPCNGQNRNMSAEGLPPRPNGVCG